MAGLSGLNIEYDRLIVDQGGNVIAVATQIPEVVVETRKELANIYAEHKLKPRITENILHSTIARVVKKPESDANLRELQGLGDLKGQIRNDHLMLTVGEVHIGPVLDFMPDEMKASHPKWKE